MTDRRPAVPGLKVTLRKDGTKKAHWVAANCTRRAKDYPVKTVTLTHLPEEEWPAQCQRLYAELQLWLAGERETPKLTFTGTINSLFDHYEQHELSPFHAVKYNTRDKYLHSLKILRKTIGARALAKLGGVDFLRWEDKLAEPVQPSGARRVQRAHDCMSMVRMTLRWGTVLELPHCKRLTDIISHMEFEGLPPREFYMTFEQAVALIDKAHEMGRSSVALAQALQFEFTFRQKDIIGEWFEDMTASGIRHVARNVMQPKRWDNGLTWSHIDSNMILTKRVTKTEKKTRAVAGFDLKEYPLVMAEIAKVPPERRVGPMIINERTGLPYTAGTFRNVWREIANAAGLPEEIQNRDSRAGGITEATDAGASLEQTRHHATHKNVSTTARYSKPTLAKTREVARIRVASRKGQTSE